MVPACLQLSTPRELMLFMTGTPPAEGGIRASTSALLLHCLPFNACNYDVLCEHVIVDPVLSVGSSV